MEDILKILADSIDILAKARNEVSGVLSNYKNKEALLEGEFAALAEQKESLDKREEAIKEIEDIQALEVSANELIKKATDEAAKLQKERDSFNKYVTDSKIAISSANSKSEENSKQIANEYKVLKANQDKFAKEKEDFKNKIAKKLVDQADK